MSAGIGPSSPPTIRDALRVLDSPLRLELLQQIRTRPQSSRELANRIGAPTAAIAVQLRRLARLRLIRAELHNDVPRYRLTSTVRVEQRGAAVRFTVICDDGGIVRLIR